VGSDLSQETTGEGEGVLVVAYSNSSVVSPSSRYMAMVIEEVKKRPEWDPIVSAMSKLKSKKSQSDLRRIARDMDRELVAIELMYAFPGRCQICPA